MLEKITFETNKPVELALTYDTGRQVTGNYGEQYYYTTVDGRCFYLPLAVGNIIHEQMQQEGIKARDRFALVRAEVREKGRVQVRWRVSRIDPLGNQPDGTFAVPAAAPVPQPELEQQLRQSIERAKTRVFGNGNAEAGAGTPAPVSVPAKQAHTNGNGNAAQTPVNGHVPAAAPDRPKTKLEDALKTVVAACHAAREYAKQIGYEAMPPFTSEDIRTMANTLMIQNGNGHNGNGGAR
jgi:hypothetical protein